MRSYVIDQNGKEVTIDFFPEGKIAIEIGSFFLNQPAQETIETVNDCEAWRVNKQDFQDVFESIKAFRDWGRSWMVGTLLANKQQGLSLITDDAASRYQRLQKEQPEILLHAPLKHIASYLGITHTSLSRIR